MYKFITPETFVYKVQTDNFYKKKETSESKYKKQSEYDYELYQNLKDLRNNNQLLKQKDESGKLINPLHKQIDMRETKKQKQEKVVREMQFQQKKKLMLQENQVKLQSDLKNLNKISIGAFQDFKEQVNLYNKYYSNTIGKEQKLDDIQFEDLNIPYQHSNEGSKYTYRQILNYTTPEVNYENDYVKQLKDEITTIELNETEKLKKQQITINLKLNKINEDELIFFKIVKNNDISTMKMYLIANKELVHSKDTIGQTGLHLAAKRNYVDICQELINFGSDIFAIDYVGRTARMLAEKYNYYKITKILLIAEENHQKKIKV